MTRWATCALLAGTAALVCAPLHAQRGGGGGGRVSGGGGGHAAPAMRVGGMSSAPRPATFTTPRFVSSPGQFASAAVSPSRAYPTTGRPGYGNVRRPYGYGVYGYYPAAVYPGYLSWGPDDFLNYSDTLSYDTAPQTAADAGQPPMPQPQAVAPDQGAYDQGVYAAAPAPGQESAQQKPAPGPYAPGYAQPAQAPAPLPEEDALTIVFKDGRPSEQIHNYALTRTTLYVPGRRIREIPLDQIDLAATVKVNREAGVSFQLPHGQ